MVTIRGGFLTKLSITNLGRNPSTDFVIDDVLSESLHDTDFLTVNSPRGLVADVTLRSIKIADSVNTWMVKHLTHNNQLLNVKIEGTSIGNYGRGLIDPASTPEHICLIAEGYGAEWVMSQAKGTLYFAQLTGPRGPLQTYYSSTAEHEWGPSMKLNH